MSKPLISKQLIDLYRKGGYVACSNFHYGSCELEALRRMRLIAGGFAMFYGPAHVLPVIIFKLKQLKKDPIPTLTHMFVNVIRSVLFGCSIMGVIRYTMCRTHQLFNGTSHINWIIIGILSSLTIFFEAKSRRGELTLYLIPRVIETVWNVMKKYGFPIRIKFFEVLIFGFAMGILMFFMHNDDKHIKPTYRSSLRHLFGTN
ncbi:hypothetical protein SteCoe_17301 [Stentor coeruleus]|uniref:Transmembrane protein 135 N-terminal domain-containing protein n=1 Tax=Stentor coeruleus TaxID=5963 RepID=A0A1R2BZ87_9CILI|nr:hypothetical protein SteCoe_17301 [Stentor coeruleus]